MRKIVSALGLTAPARGVETRIRALLASTRGVAAVEFAMILPFLLLIYCGLAEVTFGVNIDRKLTLLSRSLGDLTARATTVDSTEIKNIFGAASAVAAPYSTAAVQMRISSVAVIANGSQVQGKVCWSEGRGGLAALTTGSGYTVPAGFQTANTTFIVAEVKMPYQPVFGYALTGAFMLNETTPWPVRNVSEVAYAGVKTFKDNEQGRSATGKCLS